uniref:Temporin-1LT n=1 Tax=Rana latastei TaxID=151453 RepID=TP1_RANLT|nr:RecName: Full=Temporin-1LT [Rana latastei]
FFPILGKLLSGIL